MLLSFLEVAAVDRSVMLSTLEAKTGDFEDGVSSESARLAETNAIFTGNIRDYRGSMIPAYTPGKFLKMLEAGTRLIWGPYNGRYYPSNN